MAITEMTGAESRFLLRGVSWEFYEKCLEEIGDRAIRLSYRRGRLEMMSPSGEHERFKRLVGRMIETMTEELAIPVQSAGSTTWRQEHLDSGLEPDECYYIQNELTIRGRDRIDLATDPPPDLAVEIEISRSAVDRMAIYADLGVPEVWRYDGETLQVFWLTRDGDYERRPGSLAFPFLPLDHVVRFLDDRHDTDETTWIRSFRQWVRTELAPKRRPEAGQAGR